MKKFVTIAVLLAASITLLAGCGGKKPAATPTPTPSVSPSPTQTSAPSPTPTAMPTATPTKTPSPAPTPTAGSKGDAEQVVATPESITALVNKQFKLPEGYAPKDLVYPDVPFTFNEKIEKRMMRKEAAAALEQLFAGAKTDKIFLAGVSAYRSHATQKSVFDNYVKKDGQEKAMTYSAVPGHSEHETGLAIDVSGSTGKCAAEDCFAGTPEAIWLEKNAAKYGFIIRYPKDKQKITGYQYEPWHIRFVGTKAAQEMAAKGLTMEEYYNAVPVAK